jgi:phage tail P2-like protein
MAANSVTLLPFNATAQELALEGATARISDVDVLVRESWDPATCPVALLPWLAWAMSVDWWDSTWTEAQQRATIAASLMVHRHKGTVGAVNRIMGALGYSGQIVEWWQTAPQGVPHTFAANVEISDRGITDDAINAIAAQIDRVKPARSHYTLNLIGRTTANDYVGAYTLGGDVVTLYPYQVTEIDTVPAQPSIAFGVRDWMTTTIYPMQ